MAPGDGWDQVHRRGRNASHAAHEDFPPGAEIRSIRGPDARWKEAAQTLTRLELRGIACPACIIREFRLRNINGGILPTQAIKARSDRDGRVECAFTSRNEQISIKD